MHRIGSKNDLRSNGGRNANFRGDRHRGRLDGLASKEGFRDVRSNCGSGRYVERNVGSFGQCCGGDLRVGESRQEGE
jgi:hypothetical protein